MSLPIPKIIEKDYDEFVAILLDSIAKYTDQWTNYNPSDPGVTLIELFSWIASNLAYRMDHIPKKSYINFLRLVAGAYGQEADKLLAQENLDYEHRRLLELLRGNKAKNLRGIEDKKLFALDTRYQKELNHGVVSPELRKAFLQNKMVLSSQALVTTVKEGKRWHVQDLQNEFLILQENFALHVFLKGRDASVPEIKAAVMRFVQSPYRALSEEDFRTLTLNATKYRKGPKVRRAIVEGYPDQGKVEVIIVTEQPENYPKLISIVSEYLEDRKLIGTRIEVKQPIYTVVSLKVEVLANFYVVDELIQEQLHNKITTYLDPLSGGREQQGWPYKRPLTIYEIAQVIEEHPHVQGVAQISLGNDALEQKIAGLIRLEKLEISVMHAGNESSH